MGKFKIAFINTNREPFPLPKDFINGGLWVTGTLVDGFSKKEEFELYFFTAEDSAPPANVHKVSMGMESLYSQFGNDVLKQEMKTAHVFYQQLLLTEAIKFTKENHINLIHIHNYFPHAANLLEFFEVPVIYTLHNSLATYHRDFAKHRNVPNTHFITLNKQQEEVAKKMNFPVFKTIYNGIDIEHFPFKESSGEEMLFPNRISDEKGVVDAVKMSNIVQKKLSILGTINIEKPHELERRIIQANISGYASFLGIQPRSEISTFYGDSKCTLLPTTVEDPMSLVMIESMACGTPVIGYGRGCLPEVIKDGETGFVVNPSDDDIRGDFIVKKTGLEGLCEAVERLYSLPDDQYQQMRKNCRQHVEENFTVERMVDNYEKAYREIIDHSKNR